MVVNLAAVRAVLLVARLVSTTVASTADHLAAYWVHHSESMVELLDNCWMHRTDVKMVGHWEVKLAVLSADWLVGMWAALLESMMADATVATRAESLADKMVRLSVGLMVAPLADSRVYCWVDWKAGR